MEKVIRGLSAMLFAALILTLGACGDKDDKDGGDGGRDGRLVNTQSNEAWIDDEGFYDEYLDANYRDGFIFRADGSFTWIDDYEGTWEVYLEGTWSTANNNTLTIRAEGETIVAPYTVSGNTLTFKDEDGDWVLTRTQDIVIGNVSRTLPENRARTMLSERKKRR